MNSKAKGKRGELDLCQELRALGVSARRGVQYQGGSRSPDVVHDLPGVHLEVKRTEMLRLWAALEQARVEAEPGDIPVVAHRANGRPWVAILPLAYFVALHRVATKNIEEQEHAS